MATLIFLPFDQPFLVLENPLTASTLSTIITSGQWQPPPAYLTWLRLQHSRIKILQPCTSQHGEVVIITPGIVREDAGAARSVPFSRSLTRRQREVLQGLVDGLTIQQIATRLHVHPRTITWHIAQLKRSFGTRSLAQSIARLASIVSSSTNEEI